MNQQTLRLPRKPTLTLLITALLITAATAFAQPLTPDAKQAQLLLDQLAREEITQAEMEASTPVMQDFAEGKISEEEAHSRLIRIADGKLVKFLSNRLFRHFFRSADCTDFLRSFENRGFNTVRLEELKSSVSFFFRPQTETQSAQWEFATNTLFIPVEFCVAGTNKIRADLQPHEINTLIHELDHADKDLRNDLLRLRGKGLAGKIHAGVCWGAILCLLGLVSTTMLGSLHLLRQFLPSMGRMSRFRFLTSSHVALGVVTGSTALGLAIALVYHWILPAEISDRSRTEEENLQHLTRISRVLDTDASQEIDAAAAELAREQTMPWQIPEVMGPAVWGALGGAALGLLLGSLGQGPRLLGERKILRALNYPWALAVTCAVIGALGLGSAGALHTNRFAKFKAWEISGYYSGDCVQQVLEGLEDIAHHNTRLLHRLSLADLARLKSLDEQGQLKLLLPQRMYSLPVGQQSQSEDLLAQLASDFPGEFQRFGTVGPDYEA